MSDLPDDVVLKSISSKIEESDLVTETALKSYSDAVSKGSMSTEDWRLLTEPTNEEMKTKSDAE